MRFRPSIYSQVQLTTYAPNGGYPGFYGDGEATPPEEPKEKGAFGRAVDWVWGQFGEEITTAAGEGVTRLASGEGRAPSTTGAPATTSAGALQIPSNLTAAEKALLDKCKSEPLLKRPSCLAKTIAKINQQRAQASAGGGGNKKAASNTLWWILGGVVVAGGVAAVVYARKR